MTPGSVLITISDTSTRVAMVGGGSWTMPVGPSTLIAGELEHANRPAPTQLTNALGIVTDHLDDVLRDAPMVLSAPNVIFTGHHAEVLARVELGTEVLPVEYSMARPDADEVFRTLVAEPISERLHNPGLPAADVESIIATCCVVLAFMRRLDVTSVQIAADASLPGAS